MVGLFGQWLPDHLERSSSSFKPYLSRIQGSARDAKAIFEDPERIHAERAGDEFDGFRSRRLKFVTARKLAKVSVAQPPSPRRRVLLPGPLCEPSQAEVLLRKLAAHDVLKRFDISCSRHHTRSLRQQNLLRALCWCRFTHAHDRPGD